MNVSRPSTKTNRAERRNGKHGDGDGHAGIIKRQATTEHKRKRKGFSFEINSKPFRNVASENVGELSETTFGEIKTICDYLIKVRILILEPYIRYQQYMFEIRLIYNPYRL